MEADEAAEAVTFSEVGQWVMLPLKRPHHHEVVAKVVTQIWKVEAAVNGLPEVTVVIETERKRIKVHSGP